MESIKIENKSANNINERGVIPNIICIGNKRDTGDPYGQIKYMISRGLKYQC